MGVVIDFLGGLMIGLDWIGLVEGDWREGWEINYTVHTDGKFG